MRAVILQPFYLPYIGVFELLRLADVFVMYDDVQYSHQSWTNRNRVLTEGGPKWLSVPVHTDLGQRIDEVLIDETQKWHRKHLGTLQHAYARTPGLATLLDVIGPTFEAPPDRLVDLNITTFMLLAELLGVESRVVRSSEMDLVGTSSDRVLDCCRKLGADRYLSGPSARSYLDESSFTEAGIELEYFAVDHPTWPQTPPGDFVSHLSVVDAIANLGAGPAADAIRGCGSTITPAQFDQHFNEPSQTSNS